MKRIRALGGSSVTVLRAEREAMGMKTCMGYMPGFTYTRGYSQPRCPNEAKWGDVYCWDHRAEILRHHAEQGAISSPPNTQDTQT